MSTKTKQQGQMFAGALALLAVGVVGGDWWARRIMSREPAGDSSTFRGVGANSPEGSAGTDKPLYWYTR